METFVVGIFHRHDGELCDVTMGKIRARNKNEANEKSGLWVVEKMAAKGCFGVNNDCTVSICETENNLTPNLCRMAEDIGAN